MGQGGSPQLPLPLLLHPPILDILDILDNPPHPSINKRHPHYRNPNISPIPRTLPCTEEKQTANEYLKFDLASMIVIPMNTLLIY